MIHGIDISHFSALNDVGIHAMIREHELYFNYIKASEGMTIQDPKFEEFWKMSRDAGLICGAYHFLRPLSDPTQQANNFLTQYRKVSRAGVIPPAVDIEWTKTSNSSTEQWNQINPPSRINLIREFISKVELELNTTLVIYTASNFWKDFIQPGCSDDDNIFFAGHKLWLADPNQNGVLPVPWNSVGASFSQIHFGEQATTNDVFDLTDQNVFPGKTLDFLNC
ncbi:MAG TPA: GH25 family lysozyme, partial [Puia sp.]|nr:GH25 family lysozyme [Puia sp.]